MDTSEIQHLNIYEKLLNKHRKLSYNGVIMNMFIYDENGNLTIRKPNGLNTRSTILINLNWVLNIKL